MRTLRLSLVGTVILVLLGGLGGVALAQEEATAPAKPTPPLPPESGPGNPVTKYPEAVWTHYGEDPGGFWIIEPSTTPDVVTLPEGTGALPVVVFLTGCCDQQTQMTDVAGLKPWICTSPGKGWW